MNDFIKDAICYAFVALFIWIFDGFRTFRRMFKLKKSKKGF
jgi:hypothetical protein